MININKVLVTRYGGAGDLLMLEPVLEALYYKFSPSEVSLRTHFHYTDLHKFHPLLHEIVPGVLTANQEEMGRGIFSDEKKPQGFEYFYNTTGAIEMNSGIHGIDNFSFACNAVPMRRTPVLYLDPEIPVDPLDIVIHTPKRTEKSPRNKDFRSFNIPEEVKAHFDKKNINYKSITAIGEHPEAENSLQEFSRKIAGASLFIGPDSAGSHIAAALSVPKIISAYTKNFPGEIRTYPNTISVPDNSLESLLKAAEDAYISLDYRLPEPEVSLLAKTQKYAYGRICDHSKDVLEDSYRLIRRLHLTFEQNWREQLYEFRGRLSPGGTLFLYEKHPRFGGLEDPLMVVKFLKHTCRLHVREYSATADAYGHYYIDAQKID